MTKKSIAKLNQLNLDAAGGAASTSGMGSRFAPKPSRSSVPGALAAARLRETKRVNSFASRRRGK
jgi:hypothetical protein